MFRIHVRRPPSPARSAWGIQFAYTILVGVVAVAMVTGRAVPTLSGTDPKAPREQQPPGHPDLALPFDESPHQNHDSFRESQHPSPTAIPPETDAAERPRSVTDPQATVGPRKVATATTTDTDWRYARSGWVRLGEEIQIPQPPPNWVQSVPPLLWAALLWLAATWLLVWAA